MKTFVTILLTLLGTYGAYRGYQAYQDNRKLMGDLAAKLSKAEHKLDQVEGTLEQKRVAEAEARQRQRAALKDEIERQEHLVNELDAKLNALDVGRSNSVSVQLGDELRYQQSQISLLEGELENYKSGITREDSNLKSLKRQGSARKQAVLRAFQAQLNQQQDTMRSLRERLRNRLNLGLSLQDAINTQNQYNEAQSQFATLKSQYEVAKRSDYSEQSKQGQLSGELAGARVDQKQIEQALNLARKRLKDLQGEASHEERATTDKFKERDRLQNQLQNEKNKLANLRARL